MSGHDLLNMYAVYNNSLSTALENKNKDNNAANAFYYGIIGVTDQHNRISDRYHVTIPELNNAYFQYVPRYQETAGKSNGVISQTLSEGDTVLISFASGKFQHPLITGSKYYSGPMSDFITNLHRGNLQNNSTNVLPPSISGEAVKALAGNLGGKVEAKNIDKNGNVQSLTVVNNNNNVITTVHKGITVTDHNTVYTQHRGTDRSISQSLLSNAKKEVSDLNANSTTQRYARIAAPTVRYSRTPAGQKGYVCDGPNSIVPAQLVVKNGVVSQRQASSSITDEDFIGPVYQPYSTGIDNTKLDISLTKVADILKTVEDQNKYEQEVLLPCIENIKNIWSLVQYIASHNFSYTQPDFKLSVLCNLGSFKLKASFLPVGTLEQSINYCAPAWLSVPLLLVQGLYKLGCSNAWQTDFRTLFSGAQKVDASLMICCDDNGLPNIGFNIASSLDIASNFAISGAPVPLRDPGELPNSISFRPAPDTAITLLTPDVITEKYPNKNVIDLSTEISTIVNNDTYAPNEVETKSESLTNVPNQETEEPAVENTTIEEPNPIPPDANEEETALFFTPKGLTVYETPAVSYSLEIPSSFPSSPYRVYEKAITNNKTPTQTLIDTWNTYGIPNSDSIVNQVNNLNLTKTLPSFFQTLALISQRPLVCLVLCLVSVYAQGDREFNQNIYFKLTKKDLNSSILNCFLLIEKKDLTSVYAFMSDYYGLNNLDFVNWLYNPLLLVDWVVTQEVQLQPLVVSLYKGSIESFSVLLINLFNNIDLSKYDNLYKNYISLVKDALNLPLENSGFYGVETTKLYIPESQYY